jgi:hypothetical protein
MINKMKQELTPVSETKQIALLLQALEGKLSAFNKILHPLDHRRGLINLGGQALKMIFGTATISEVHELHEAFEKLRERNDDSAFRSEPGDLRKRATHGYRDKHGLNCEPLLYLKR